MRSTGERRDEDLGINLSLVEKEDERVKMCCRRAKIKPAPNSIAEKIKKKNVRERIFISSKRKPVSNAITYSVIQISSAIIRA